MGEWEWGEGKKEEKTGKTGKDERRKRKVGKEGKGNTSQEQIRLSSFCSLSLNDMGKRQQLKKEETHKHKYLFLVFLLSVPVVVQLLQLVVLTVHPTTVQSSCAWPCCTPATLRGPYAPEHPWSGPEEKHHMCVC